MSENIAIFLDLPIAKSNLPIATALAALPGMTRRRFEVELRLILEEADLPVAEAWKRLGARLGMEPAP